MRETRKLAAIMFTDIVGYSGLMSKDEKLALQVLSRNREIHKAAIQKHNGEFIKEIGDGTLSIFKTSSDAVNCALEIHRECCIEKDFSVRIGIHIGEIVTIDNDVFGDGVNIASRIESTGSAGGIFLSERVYEDIKNKTVYHADFVGEKKLKNIDHPVKVYALREGEAATFSRVSNKPGLLTWLRKKKYPVIVIALMLVIVTLGIVFLVDRKTDSGLNSKLLAVARFENRRATIRSIPWVTWRPTGSRRESQAPD